MANLSAPEQNEALRKFAALLRGREEVQAKMNPTMMGALMDLILPSSQFVEKASYGDPLFRMPPPGTGGYVPITADKKYVAEAATLLPSVPPAARGVSKAANATADALVRMITRNPQATAPAALEAASNMSPLARMFNPDEAKGLLDTSYRGLHSAPNREFGAPLFELNKIYPDNIYSPNAARLYGHGGDAVAMDKRTAQLLQAFRGKPDAEVTIYRAVPKDKTIKDINAGDWVTINKDYAKQHGESVLRGDYKILERKVRAKDIWTNADSIHEFGYDPQVTQLSTAMPFMTDNVTKQAATSLLDQPAANMTERLYHGTSPAAAKQIERSGFDINKSADGTVWFTSNPQIGEVAATNKGAVVERLADLNKLKLGGWKETDKYSVDELIQQGYDGLRLVDGNEITYQIFNPEKLRKPLKK